MRFTEETTFTITFPDSHIGEVRNFRRKESGDLATHSLSSICKVNNLDLIHVLQMVELLVPPYFGWIMQFNPKLYELVVMGLDCMTTSSSSGMNLEINEKKKRGPTLRQSSTF